MKNIFAKLNTGFLAKRASLFTLIAEKLDKHPVIAIIIIALALTLVIEILSRRSVVGGLLHMVYNPMVFIYNAIIILCTLSLSMLFSKKRFFIFTLSFLWLLLGITNCVVMTFRSTPLVAVDFLLIISAWPIIDMYLDFWHIVLIVALFVFVTILIIKLWKSSPKQKVHYWRSIVGICVMAVVVFFATNIAIGVNIVSEDFYNLPKVYEDYGFAYCFSKSVVDIGIDKPEEYTEERAEGILKLLGETSTVKPKDTPNIIYVQLESFFDVNHLERYSFSENPVPVFTELKEKYPHGFLTVSTVGAGTANTEFEVLTGINLDFFGAGEYPYETILRKVPCESLSYNLRELGYTSHAIHNHIGSFYSRNIVFPNLGFDTFTSLEYMQDIEQNALGWAHDSVLTKEVLDALRSTDNSDFVFAISVQAHGKYPDVIDFPQKITATEPEDTERLVGFPYFINQLHETDAFIGDLIGALERMNEPTILVIYGDHLPGLEIDPNELENEDIFQTEYVIWTNTDIKYSSKDLTAYQLSAHVTSGLGFDNGFFTKINQQYSGHPDYNSIAEFVAYDILYGDNFIYGEALIPTPMQMGVRTIEITNVLQYGEDIYVYGNNFTQYSTVYINGDKTASEFVTSGLLKIPKKTQTPGSAFAISQVGTNGYALGQSEVYISK